MFRDEVAPAIESNVSPLRAKGAEKMKHQQSLKQMICLFIVALLMLLVSGCKTMEELFATPTPTNTATPTPTNTAVPTFTATPTNTPTSTNTVTPTLVPTHTPTYTSTATPIPGKINRLIVGANTSRPLVDALIILCRVSEPEEEYSSCILQALPIALSDANGTFNISDIPPGIYVLTYALPGELAVFTDNEWKGIEVVYPDFIFWGDGVALSPSSVESTGFWESGAEMLSDFTVNIVETEDGHMKLFMGEGSIQSINLGISIMFEDNQMAPEVHVQEDETIDIEWKVKGR